jgi:hypothetical protein
MAVASIANDGSLDRCRTSSLKHEDGSSGHIQMLRNILSDPSGQSPDWGEVTCSSISTATTLPDTRLCVEVILIVERFGWICQNFSNPQLNPQKVMFCAIFNDLGGPWQSPRSCKLL